ncbi:hypothetical protein JF729_06980 [Mycobacterium intracellulare]|uniref:hypothetical protein n=1 Tax=Mycobacterium intracellulare TaxID=1767 RepID=UPI001CDA267B|nr:hypothetical protein [Mycobacterium intracellulare]MCA2247539.1 hypothetical protein [Mycobacterium intracellulare]
MSEQMVLRGQPPVVGVSPAPPAPVTPPITGADPVSLAVAGLPALANALAAKCGSSIASSGSLGGKTDSTHRFLTAMDAQIAAKVQAAAPKDGGGIVNTAPTDGIMTV